VPTAPPPTTRQLRFLMSIWMG